MKKRDLYLENVVKQVNEMAVKKTAFATRNDIINRVELLKDAYKKNDLELATVVKFGLDVDIVYMSHFEKREPSKFDKEYCTAIIELMVFPRFKKVTKVIYNQ